MKIFGKEIDTATAILDGFVVVMLILAYSFVAFVLWIAPVSVGEKIGIIFLIASLIIFLRFAERDFVAALGVVLTIASAALYIAVEVTDTSWRNATVHVVAKHNKIGAPRTPVTVEEMTPEKLWQLTDPCTIWDWRERGRVCDRR